MERWRLPKAAQRGRKVIEEDLKANPKRVKVVPEGEKEHPGVKVHAFVYFESILVPNRDAFSR